MDQGLPQPQGTLISEVQTLDWLPRKDVVSLGLTAGASTPDSAVGLVIERLEAFTTPTA